MKKPKMTYKQWRWPRYLLAMTLGWRGRRFFDEKFGMDMRWGVLGEAMRDELDARAEENLRLHKRSKSGPRSEKTEENALSREYIEKKLQFLVDCGYTYRYNEIDGERSFVYTKQGEKDGSYIEIHAASTYEYCMVRTKDVPFAEIAKSKLADRDWSVRYQNAAPLVRLDMAAELLRNS